MLKPTQDGKLERKLEDMEMKMKNRVSIGDLIISRGGIIIGVTGLGLMIYLNFALKSAFPQIYGLVAGGFFILYELIGFASYYETVNHKRK